MKKKISGTSKVTFLVVGLLTAGTAASFFLQKSEPVPMLSTEGVPLPFRSENETNVKGSISTIGRKNGIDIRQVAFDADEVSEPIQGTTYAKSMDFVLTPDSSTISNGAPFCVSMTSGKKYFGYKYTSRAATRERAAADEAAAGVPKTYSELFEGEFFASPEARAADSFIADFEAQKNMIFKNPCSITLDKNARYIVVVNDVSTTVTARGLTWCGDGDTTGAEQCDDANAVSGDGCNACQIEQGYVCNTNPNPSQCEALCGNGDTNFNGADGIAGNADDEQCDDANVAAGDGCNACQIEQGYVCNTNPNPSQCETDCGDGLKKGSEQCDDGNNIETDTCTNECKHARCGDGIQQPLGADGTSGNSDDEDCDDGNTIDDDACDNECKILTPF